MSIKQDYSYSRHPLRDFPMHVLRAVKNNYKNY